MADFSDAEDILLVQLALGYEATGRRVSWKAIHSAMKKKKGRDKKTAIKLKMRLKTLTNRYGRDLAQFPSRYLQHPPPPSPDATSQNQAPHATPDDCGLAQSSIRVSLSPSCSCPHEPRHVALGGAAARAQAAGSGVALVSSGRARGGGVAAVMQDNAVCNMDLLLEFERILARDSNNIGRRECRQLAVYPSSRTLQLEFSVNGTQTSKKAQSVCEDIFRSVTRAEVRQGRREENVGELLAPGVSLMLDACQLTNDDVFVDIGSGVGNVVAQVALESCARLMIGVEIRSIVALRGQTLMREWASMYPRLQQIRIIQGDITDTNTASDIALKDATVLYCHNTLFRAAVQYDIERLCCSLKKLRIIVVQTPFCPRHTARCTKTFCLLFVHRDTALWPVSFTAKGAAFAVYDRRRDSL